MTDRRRIVLDCDPGVDDTFAILTALRWCQLDAVTTVAGNVGVEHTTANALGVLAVAGADVPVHRGAPGPLTGQALDDASDVHGETGLGGVELPVHQMTPVSDDAVGALLALTTDPDVTLVAIGPLTNVALAMQQDPGYAERLGGLVIMGGSLDAGNVTAAAEFNIWADPEAAEVVFTSGVDVTMVGLNLTKQVQMGAAEIARLRAGETASANFAADALDFYSDYSLAAFGVKKSSMHDPCAVLEVARPDLFERRRMHVAVETGGIHTRGMTLCDRRPNGQEPNASVLVAARAEEAVDLIVAATIEPLG